MEVGRLTAAVSAALAIAKLPQGATVNIQVDSIDLSLAEGIDNYPVIKAAIDAIPDKGRAVLGIPLGNFFCSKTIEWHNKTISLIGKGVGISALEFSGEIGIRVTRQNSVPRSKIAGLSVINLGDKVAGKHGMDLLQITDITDVYIKGFGGHGIMYYGNLGYMHSDVSGSVGINIEVAECAGDGIHMEGGDANALVFTGCNFRDNGGYGWADHSFLGNTAIGCMGHNNAKGSFFAGNTEGTNTNNNARAALIGCYDEGGQPLSKLSVYTTVIGGTWGSGFQIFGNNGLPKRGTYLPLEGDQYYNDANNFYNQMRFTPKTGG